MSSFLGHSLAACTVFAAAELPEQGWRRWAWAGWLVVLASAPDVDYLIPELRLPGPSVMRISHSLVGTLTLPLVTVAVMAAMRVTEPVLRSVQAVVAGLSHLVLDQLVGVTPAPLLWPFSDAMYKLPFGVLPSAGRIVFTNWLLWRNLVIETGVLAPVFLIVCLMRRPSAARYGLVAALVGVTVISAMMAAGLAR